MKPRDILLAILTSTIWGLGFAVSKIGVESFSGAQLTALRFIIAGAAVLVLPRPAIRWPLLLGVGATLYLGQFLLLFFAFQLGMPPGVASVTQQSQVFFTVLLAALLFRELPAKREAAGMGVAFTGLAGIGLTAGADLPLFALMLAVGSALSWAAGNILLKRLAGVPMLPLIAWASLVPPIPALIFSYFFDAEPSFWQALTRASWLGIGSAFYLAIFATWAAYVMWGRLLGRYPAAKIAPFALLSPCVGVLASVLLFGEEFSPLRLTGMLLIIAGLTIILLPRRAAARPTPPP